MSGETPFAAGFMDDYFAECDEHLGTIRRLLLDLEGATGDRPVTPAVLEELFRSFHSIKGISGMVELREAEMLAHHMESYLRLLRQADARLTVSGVDALVAGVDALERTIAARRDHQPAPAVDHIVAQLAAIVPAVSAGGAASADPDAPALPVRASWRVMFAPSASLLARGINVDTVRARLREAGEIVDATPKVLPDGIAFEFLLAADLDASTVARWRADGITAEPAAADLRAASSEDPGVRESAARLAPSHVVRVDLTRLDDLMRMIGDLVISRARLDDALARVEPHVPPVAWRAVQENTQTIERQLRDLREGVMRVRLVPVGEIFRRMPFVVRDLARDSGKRVRLELRGQETEIDKFLIERMMDPVLHLVRNAVSHAFELPAERAAAGKPEEGSLTLSAAASIGDMVMLEIADDGRGIDAGAVAARARAMGLDVPDGPLDSATLLEVLCAPGFSTRDETDRASGRGVGMAVVKTTVEELNGSMSIETAPGEGTRFVIELPLTLSIADALIAHVGDRTFAVPQANVREVVEVEPASLRQIEHHEIAPFRGGTLPILRLSRIFGIPERPRRALHVLVVGTGLDAVGVAVDRVSGQREIVVRNMADSLIDVEGVAGATDLGDGRVVLILNLPDLARHARARGIRAGEIGERAMTAVETFILFGVAGTMYALRSRDVAHVEMVEQVTAVPNAVPFVDGVVFSRGEVVPALNLRARFGFEKTPDHLSTRLLVVRAGDRTVGLVVDAAREFVAIDAASIQPPATALTGLSGRYLEGVANLGDRLVLVLDLAEVLTFNDPVVESHPS